MTTAYSLRPATHADLDALWRILKAAFEDYVVRAEGTKPDAWWRAELDEDYVEGHMQIIVVGGQDAGILDVHPGPGDDVVDVNTIAIAPAYQGIGLGTRILRDVIAGVPRVTLRCRKGNRAKALYDRLGFRVVREDDRRWYMERP